VRARKSRISAAIAGRLESDAWLVVSRPATDVDDPAVRERDDRRLAGENDLAAEDVAVEVGGGSTSSATMKCVSAIPSLSVGRLAMVVLLSFGLQGDGQCRWLSAGEVGAADPDHGDVDGQGEQGDPGGDQEAAGEAGGNGMTVDRRG